MALSKSVKINISLLFHFNNVASALTMLFGAVFPNLEAQTMILRRSPFGPVHLYQALNKRRLRSLRAYPAVGEVSSITFIAKERKHHGI